MPNILRLRPVAVMRGGVAWAWARDWRVPDILDDLPSYVVVLRVYVLYTP
jgi:hypothetical protein